MVTGNKLSNTAYLAAVADMRWVVWGSSKVLGNGVNFVFA